MTAPRRPIITLKAKPKPVEPVEAPPAPAPISKNKLAKERLKAATAWLAATWPAAFRSPVRPLAIGAGAEILAHPSGNFTVDERHAAIRAWTGRSAYQTAIIERRMRVKLDGTDASPVSDDERRHAFERVKARDKKKGLDSPSSPQA